MTFCLFPGQGSQRPGMGRDFHDASPAAREVFDEARTLTPDGFIDTIFDGTEEQLRDTRVAQVALLVVETAMARHLAAAGHVCGGAAGHSLGEIPALVATGALSFADAVSLTTVRARLMSENVPQGAMAAVMGLSPEAIEKALPEGVGVANYNGPQQTIITGTKDGIEQAQALLKEAGAKRFMPLNVSGPFHSALMGAASAKFAEEVRAYTFQPPRVPFVSSVTGTEVSTPEAIMDVLSRQIDSPVRWTDVMRTVGPGSAFEVGPGRVLQGIARRFDGGPQVEPTDTLEATNALEAG